MRKNILQNFMQKIKIRPKITCFIYQYGYSLFQNGKFKESVPVLEKLNTDDIYLQNGMYTLGKSALKLNNKEKARSAFFRASRLDFDKVIQEEAWLNYAKLSYELEFNSQALESTQTFLSNFPIQKK